MQFTLADIQWTVNRIKIYVENIHL